MLGDLTSTGTDRHPPLPWKQEKGHPSVADAEQQITNGTLHRCCSHYSYYIRRLDRALPLFFISLPRNVVRWRPESHFSSAIQTNFIPGNQMSTSRSHLFPHLWHEHTTSMSLQPQPGHRSHVMHSSPKFKKSPPADVPADVECKTEIFLSRRPWAAYTTPDGVNRLQLGSQSMQLLHQRLRPALPNAEVHRTRRHSNALGAAWLEEWASGPAASRACVASARSQLLPGRDDPAGSTERLVAIMRSHITRDYLQLF